MEYDELVRMVQTLKREFEDHRHTGTDSLPVETTIQSQGSITAVDEATVDGTYGSEESGVINNIRTRQGEIEAALVAIGALE
jgi:hypothetical protein